MDAAFERNAFRVLCLPADAQTKEVYRQQQRIQNALELGDDDVVSSFPFLPKVPLSAEAVLEAVHRVEKQRAIEELFWVHDLGGKFDFDSAPLETALTKLRADAARNTTKGSVAQHNLAVIFTCLAQELNGSRRFDYWKDAIRSWNATVETDVFWHFMQDRDELSNGNSGGTTPNELRNVVRETIRRAVLKEIWSAVDERNNKAIALMADVIREYSQLLDADSTLTTIGNQMAKDASVVIGGILDRLSAVGEDTDKVIARKALVSVENDLRQIGEDFDAVIGSFGSTEVFGNVYDARAIAFKRLSIVYFNVVSDEPESLRLVMEARSLARDPKLISEVEVGWTHIRRSLLCSEALALIEAKKYAEAQEKLAIALTLSTDEQKAEIEEMQQSVHRAWVCRDVDTSKRNPGLSTVNGIGARFYGKRDFDQKTRSYITVHWFVILFLPIIPLGSYRVCNIGPDLYTIYGRVPLSPLLRKYRWAVLALIALLILVVTISNSDAGGRSTSSRSDMPPTYTSSAPASGASSDHASVLVADQQNSTDVTRSRAVSGDAIEAERAELKSLSDSLDLQQRQIDQESAALKRMESYIRFVKDTYTEETVPDTTRDQYNSTVDEYNTKLPAYNRAIRAYNADLQQYKERVTAFNQRVDLYNSNR